MGFGLVSGFRGATRGSEDFWKEFLVWFLRNVVYREGLSLIWREGEVWFEARGEDCMVWRREWGGRVDGNFAVKEESSYHLEKDIRFGSFEG